MLNFLDITVTKINNSFETSVFREKKFHWISNEIWLLSTLSVQI